jgi:hypothetical protein
VAQKTPLMSLYSKEFTFPVLKYLYFNPINNHYRPEVEVSHSKTIPVSWTFPNAYSTAKFKSNDKNASLCSLTF